MNGLKRIPFLFARARAWQVFLFFVISYGLLSLPFIAMESTPGFHYLLGDLATFAVLLPMFAWSCSVAFYVNAKIPEGYRPATTLLKLSMMYVFLVFPIAVSLLGQIISDPVMASFFFMALCCFVYLCYFPAKNLVTWEKGEPTCFGDLYINEIGSFWVFPLGVWFVQPRINRIADMDAPH